MRTSGVVVGMMSLLAASALVAGEGENKKGDSSEKKSVLDFEMKNIDGETVRLDRYKGDVLLIVNVASRCGLTDGHYKALEPMYKKYQEQGFRILAFPANNFMAQEPGTDQEIKKFCTDKYGVTFDLFSKVSVKGDDQCPLYKFLTEHPNEDIAGPVQWNFQKYLVNRDGEVIAKFSPRVAADDEKLAAAVEEALRQPRPEASANQG